MEKYKEIHQTLVEELENGKYPVGAHFPSEYELGIRFDCSRLTANKAVKLLVADGWLERGVRGSGTRVRQLSHFPKGTILYLGLLDHVFFATLLSGISNRANYRGYYVTVGYPNATEFNGFLNRACASGKFAGIVTDGYGYFDEMCPGLPVVYIDTCDKAYHAEKNYVVSDNLGGGRRMLQALAARGYRDIVIYASSGCVGSERFYRVQGYQDAMRELGMGDVERRLFVCSTFTKFDAASQLKNILKSFPQVQAIVTTTDDLAMPMRQALADADIASPERILVTGYGNVGGISDAYRLPSVEQHPFHMGVAAADLLLDIVERKPLSMPHQRHVDTELVNLEFIPVRR